ncbi:hypothetical protein WJX75_004707 [Coccomyxa subellipsoidea]|uniref:J domain-containing protein n=1 Tax=Coccomyxa subellipsoidea TaxID=248742 RepID=A0ABR2YF88_9CHLO
MGLEQPIFDIDYRHLDQSYRALQFKLHPDKFGLASKKEKSYSEEASSLINKAYDTLRSPLLRASYMVRFGAVTA